MKSLICYLAFILCAVICQAQTYPVPQNLGSPTTLVTSTGAIKSKFIYYYFSDTTSANLDPYIKNYPFAHIGTSSDGLTWTRNYAATKWLQDLTSGGSTGILSWLDGGNSLFNSASGNNILGTMVSKHGLSFYTSGVERFTLDSTGILPNVSGVQGLGVGTDGKLRYFTGSSSTPTWQQTLDAGSTTNKVNNIILGDTLKFNVINAPFVLEGDDIGNIAFMLKRNTDAGALFDMQLDGHLEWGDGSSNIDVGLTRISQGVLEVNGTNRAFFDFELGTVNTGGLRFSNGSLVKSSFYFDGTNNILNIEPYLGNLTIDTLNNVSAQNALMGWTTTSGANRGKIGYLTVASPLNITSGVLGVTAGATSLVVGTTPITSGTTTRILYDNAGILGEYTLSGSGTAVAMATSPDITTSITTPSVTFSIANTTATTGNIFGAATTLNVGGTPTTAITHNYSTNATAAATTKTVNLGTGGAPSSTTNINIGSANGGTTTINSPTVAGTIFNAATGFRIGGAAASRKMLVGNGTNFVASTETWATPGSSGNVLTSDGTNWTSAAPSSFALSNGSGTTANGTAVDLGGNATGNVTINMSGNVFEVSSVSQAFLKYDNSTYYKISIDGADIAGNVQFSTYGAGAITADASGNLTSVSDERLKNIQGIYSGGLNELMKINPIIYKWKPSSGLETKHDYIGFSAQNIKDVLGEGSYGINKQGYLSIQDRAIMATMINAIQEMQKEINDLKQQIKNK